MKRFLVIATILFLSFTTVSYAYETYLPQKEESLVQYLETITVSIMSSGSGTGICSGTIIREGFDTTYILTAKHCIGVAEDMRVENNKVKLIVTSATDDIALLYVEGIIPGKSVATIGSIGLKVGEMAYHVSYPNFEKYYRKGVMFRYNHDWQFLRFKAIGGCSGGGVFNEKGELVGVLWGGFNYNPITIIEPLKDVIKFLEIQ